MDFQALSLIEMQERVREIAARHPSASRIPRCREVSGNKVIEANANGWTMRTGRRAIGRGSKADQGAW
jgi:hypothetical protein